MSGKFISTTLGMGLLALSLQANAVDDHWYLAPMLSHISPDSDLNSDDDWGLGLSLGKAINERWNMELGLRSHSIDLDTGGDMDQTSVGVDGLYFFSRNPSFSPFALLGAGYMRSDMPGDRENSIAANVGLGFLTKISNNMDLRADARYRWSESNLSAYNESGFGDWLVNIGLNIALNKPAASPRPSPTNATTPIAAQSVQTVDSDAPLHAEAAAPASAPMQEPAVLVSSPPATASATVTPVPPKDTDADGVVDGLDKCPMTPAGRKVNAEGCELDSDGDGVVDALDQCPATPAGRTVNARGCELDSDADGVVDGVDKCPATPVGRKVNAEGCELDSDGDGVMDSSDKCPDTPKGDQVDDKGCTIASTIILKGVNFDSDTAKLRPESTPVLDEAAEALKRYPHLDVEVAGHTDSTGDAKYNQHLSEERAKTVCDYFIQKGIEAQRLRSKGYGESKPLTNNSTKDGREENRRVELRLKAE